MTWRRTTVLPWAVIAALVAGCGDRPASETGAPSLEPAPTVSSSPPGPAGRVTVTVLGQGDPRTMTLTCDPPGGTHPTPEAACAALTSWQALRAESPQESPRSCPRPVDSAQTVSLTGTWEEGPLDVVVRHQDCTADWGRLLSVIAPLNAGLG